MVGADASPTWSSHTEQSKSAIRVLQKREEKREQKNRASRRKGHLKHQEVCKRLGCPRGARSSPRSGVRMCRAKVLTSS